MKKKATKKTPKSSTTKRVAKSPSRRTRVTAKRKKNIELFRFISITISVLVLICGYTFVQGHLSTPRVLGASTFLADHGSDDSGSGDSGSSENSGPGGGSPSGDLNSGSIPNGTTSGSNSSDSTGSGENTIQSPSGVNPGALVDCSGPDGHHITVSFQKCKEFNSQWNHTKFTFTQIKTHTSSRSATLHSPKFDGGSESNPDDNASGSAHHDKHGLDGMNEPEISTRSGIVLRDGHTEAESHFPLSVDPVTHALTVTTPSGTKQVTVLPDQAIQNILQRRIMDSVEESNETASGTADTTQKVELTELNNEPVFQVQGISSKKLLGLFPISFAKVAFVSTSTGDVVQTNESIFSRILEVFSF